MFLNKLTKASKKSNEAPIDFVKALKHKRDY